MCDGDLDAILSYLSSKINKIFCDREFVGCVKEDFDVILQSASNHCVVFPRLKPIFLKVLRHQAVIFNLSVFCIGSGSHQAAVVCKKEVLREHATECPCEEKQTAKAMDSEEQAAKTALKRTSRTNRPTQSYYVPPAQRSKKKADSSSSKTSKKTPTKIKTNGLETSPVLNEKENNADKGESRVQEEYVSLYVHKKAADELVDLAEHKTVPSQLPNNECNVSKHSEDLTNAECLKDEPILEDIVQEEAVKTAEEVYLYNEENKSLLKLERQSDDLLSNSFVPNENNVDIESVNSSLDNILTITQKDTDPETNVNSINVQKSDIQQESFSKPLQQNQKVQSNGCDNSANECFISKQSANCKNHNFYRIAEHILHQSSENPQLSVIIMQLSSSHSAEETAMSDSEKINIIVEYLESLLEQYKCELELKKGEIKEKFKDFVTQTLISQFNLPFTIITFIGEYLTESSDSFSSADNALSSNTIDSDTNIQPVVILSTKPNMCDTSGHQIIKSEQKIINKKKKSASPLYIKYNDTPEKKPVDTDIDSENEEMQRAIENINRKSRSLIKHNIRNADTLAINKEEQVTQQSSTLKEKISTEASIIKKGENISNWEDMFDENGELQQDFIGEIVKRIGCDVKVVKASHDYSAYQNTKYQDLEHVIELYDFPSTFKTQDLIQLYRGASSEPMYVKWCDDTHALLVLSSPTQAQRALNIEHDIIKSRPLTEASSIAAVTASSADLKPAMKRPQTNMQTARRLINTHLGTKSTLSKEEVEQERQALRDAREQRRQERQNEKDAWEGRPRNAKSH